MCRFENTMSLESRKLIISNYFGHRFVQRSEKLSGTFFYSFKRPEQPIELIRQ